MKFGDYEIEQIRLCRFRMDGGAMFGVIPKKLWLRAYPHCDDDNRIALAAYAYLVRGGGRTIIIDCGIGNKLEEKTSRIFDIEWEVPSLQQALRTRGVQPEDVTDVILTHLHFDHAGGATTTSPEGRAVPVFPNATHYIQIEQLAWARKPSMKDRASYTPDNWEPLHDAGLLNVLQGGQDLLPGIELHLVHGHTPAMQLVVIRGDGPSGSKGCVLTIDLFPTSGHLPVHYGGAVDNFPLQVLEEKERWLKRVGEEKLAVCFGHDAVTGCAILKPGHRNYEVGDTLQ